MQDQSSRNYSYNLTLPCIERAGERACCLRGDPFITFAPRGGRGVRKVVKCANDKTDRLREYANEGGEGVQNSKNFVNVLDVSPPIS